MTPSKDVAIRMTGVGAYFDLGRLRGGKPSTRPSSPTIRPRRRLIMSACMKTMATAAALDALLLRDRHHRIRSCPMTATSRREPCLSLFTGAGSVRRHVPVARACESRNQCSPRLRPRPGFRCF